MTPTKSRGLSSPVARRVPEILLYVEGFQHSVCGSGAHHLGYKAVLSMFPFWACRAHAATALCSHSTDLCALVQSLALLLPDGLLASWQPYRVIPCLQRSTKQLLDDCSC
jgi:hypothetical protein